MDSASRGRAVGQARMILFFFSAETRTLSRLVKILQQTLRPYLNYGLPDRSLTPLNKLHTLLGPMVDEVNPQYSTVDMAGARKPVFNIRVSQLACNTFFLEQAMWKVASRRQVSFEETRETVLRARKS
jgi:hypothetical protein